MWQVWVRDGAGNQLSDVVEFSTDCNNPNREIYLGFVRVTLRFRTCQTQAVRKPLTMKPIYFVLLCILATSLLIAGCFGNREVSEAAPAPLRSPHPTFTPTPMQPPTPVPPPAAADAPAMAAVVAAPPADAAAPCRPASNRRPDSAGCHQRRPD
jgi:hypothetical protein